jgi:hypothetical protein
MGMMTSIISMRLIMNRFTVWQVDDLGALMYACPDSRSVGWNQVKKEPPGAPAGFVQVWVSPHNQKTDPAAWAEDGDWVPHEEHRKADLWIARGEKYTLGADHDGVSYNGLGVLPAWLLDEEPPAPPLTLEQLREAKQAAAAAKRWDVMTGGITLPSGVRVGTEIDDQNRITSVVAMSAQAGLQDTDVVSFKAASGFVRLTIGDIKQIGGIIGRFVQDCFAAEEMHYDAIAEITDYTELQGYDVSGGWPDNGSPD